LLYIAGVTINDNIMEEKEYFEKIGIEFKKLNFALDSYRYCHMKAVVRTADEWKGNDTKVSFLLQSGDEKGILVYQTTVGKAFEDLLSFKKKSLDLCTHAKKEAI